MKEIAKLKGIIFVIIIILFFFPFVDIRCNNQKLYEFTGFELATGGKTIDYNGEEQKTEPNRYASLVLILTFLSLLISFIHNRLMIFLTTIFSIAGFASMILLYYDLKKQVSPPDSMIVLEIDFLIPYFAVLVLLFVYIVFSFYILTMKKI